MRYLLCGIVLTLLAIGCGGDSDPSAPADAEAIPSYASYEVIEHQARPEDAVFPVFWRKIPLRLRWKVHEDILRAIALKVVADDGDSDGRTIVQFYLPGMVLEGGPWAMVSFKPEPEVQVLGFTAGEEIVLTEGVEHPSNEDKSHDVIGRWIDNTVVSEIMTIYRQDGAVYMRETFRDGEYMTKRLVETRSPSGRRFEPRKPTPHHEYYLIDSDGNLRTADDDGLVDVATKLK